MNNKPEHIADISAELRNVSRSAEYCELQPTVFGKPIARYFAELADRLDAATASEAMRLKEALAYLEHVGETGDGRLHFSDMVRVGNAKAMLKIIIAHRETESTVHNCNCVPQTVHNMAAMYEALVAVKKLFDGRIMWQSSIRACHKQVNAALVEPPRNCDIYGTSIQLEKAFEYECRQFREGKCKPWECSIPAGTGASSCLLAFVYAKGKSTWESEAQS